MNFASKLEELRACGEAIAWVGKKSLPDAWNACHRGDWMLWLAVNAGVDRKRSVIAACLCAETALKFVPAGEERPARAIATARAWARGEASIGEVHAAAVAAVAVAGAAYAAAYTAARAAYAAADDAAYVAADAAYVAADDAAFALRATADDVAVRKKTLADCANLVRSVISAEQVEAALEAL